MKKLLNIGVTILGAGFLMVNFIVIIPSILGAIDYRIRTIRIDKYYFGKVLSCNTLLGILGLAIYMVDVVLIILFYIWATMRINALKFQKQGKSK